jgi:hypothetical protein
MLQALEHEYKFESDNNLNEERPQRKNNPRKYLLYQPQITQLLLYLATCFKDISDSCCILLYISADGPKSLEKESPEGIFMAVDQNSQSFKPSNILYTHDLVPFSRKPLFLIVDSNNSKSFQSFPNNFDAPFACLMSPTEYPSSIKSTIII